MVEDNLVSGEAVQLVITGMHMHSIVALDRRVLVAKVGESAGALFGGRVTSFRYEDIRAVQLNTSVTSASIELHLSDVDAHQAGDLRSGSRERDPARMPNAIVIPKRLKVYRPGLVRLQALIDDARTPKGLDLQPAASQISPGSWNDWLSCIVPAPFPTPSSQRRSLAYSGRRICRPRETSCVTNVSRRATPVGG